MSEPLPTRYPGLSSFTTAQKDIFFGRTQETFDLFNFISLERMVVLFSKSGYGKTSLLQAGLIPLLYDHRMTPVLIRFGTDKANPEWHFKSQFEETYFRFMGVDARAEAALAENETFWAQIRRCPFVNGDDRFTPLFIFDQFEELFTLYPDQQRRQRFITELADLIQGQLPESLHEEILLRLISRDISDQEAAEMEQVPPMKFIFSIRSDMLHFLDELSKPIPRILDARYQLFGLSEQQAEDAIVEPAKLGTETIAQMNGSSMPLRFLSPPFGFEPSAKTEILSTLIKNDEVESFQLQAVCQAIEKKIMEAGENIPDTLQLLATDGAGLPLVNSAFYGGREGIEDVIDKNYRDLIDELAVHNPAWPDIARQVLEDALVNRHERRQSVDVTELLVEPALLDELTRKRLIRKEPRLNSFYYEISHDTWLNAVLKSKKAREKSVIQKRRTILFIVIVATLSALAITMAIFAVLQTQKAVEVRNHAAEKIKIAEEKSEDAQYRRMEAETEMQRARDAWNNEITFRQEEEKEHNLIQLALIRKGEEAHFDLKESILKDSVNYSGKPKKITSKIWQSPNIKKLNLTNTKLSALPPEIGNLQQLQWLYLGTNDLTMLPKEIGNLQQLQQLILNNNRLIDVPAIGRLKQLKILDLSSNNLTKLPDEIGNLKQLNWLNLSDNNLTNLPDEIGNLKQLKTLNLSGNNLKTLPPTIKNLKGLKTLDLSGNPLPEEQVKYIHREIPQCTIIWEKKEKEFNG